jgi:hypothetical protein
MVPAQYPKVTAQHPFWGGVSILNPMRSMAGFGSLRHISQWKAPDAAPATREGGLRLESNDGEGNQIPKNLGCATCRVMISMVDPAGCPKAKYCHGEWNYKQRQNYEWKLSLADHDHPIECSHKEDY